MVGLLPLAVSAIAVDHEREQFFDGIEMTRNRERLRRRRNLPIFAACCLTSLALALLGRAPKAQAAEPAAHNAAAFSTLAQRNHQRVGRAATRSATESEAPSGPADASPNGSSSADSAKLGPRMQALEQALVRTLSYYHTNWVLDAHEHTPWEVMHAIVAFGVKTRLKRGGNNSPDVSAIGWLCFNGPCKRIQILTLEDGQLRVKKGPYVQGHHGQLLAMLAQSRLVTSYPIRVGGREFTVADLIEAEKLTCEPRSELTFKLISLTHYLSTEDTWTDQRGETWSIARLVAEEIEQPILRKAACGGTHRLMGLSYAVEKRRQEGLPIDGQFARAEKYTRDYRAYAYRLQNRDGSFSTKWFERPEAEPDVDRRLKTTGHILEWMVYSSPQSELDDPRLLRAVVYLNNLLWRGRSREWEIGPLGHALHALSLYHKRRFATPRAKQVRDLARGASEAPDKQDGNSEPTRSGVDDANQEKSSSSNSPETLTTNRAPRPAIAAALADEDEPERKSTGNQPSEIGSRDAARPEGTSTDQSKAAPAQPAAESPAEKSVSEPDSVAPFELRFPD